MEQSLLQALPNLGVGVASVVGIIVIVSRFIAHMESRATKHEEAMREREVAFRNLESEVRNSVLAQLHENREMMVRVIDLLNKI